MWANRGAFELNNGKILEEVRVIYEVKQDGFEILRLLDIILWTRLSVILLMIAGISNVSRI